MLTNTKIFLNFIKSVMSIFFNRIVPHSSFEAKMVSLKKIKKEHKMAGKPVVVISGAGPAGLIRGIHSILNGNPTTLIEKRSADQEARANSVALNRESITLLKNDGIYDYLVENRLIFSQNTETGLSVRLGDLEKAAKAVLSRLTKKQVIVYDSEISQINSDSNGKIRLNLQKKDGSTIAFSSPVDLLSVGEGARSHTADLLGISRDQILPNIPAVAAIFKDNRPKITHLSSFLNYAKLTVLNLFANSYYFSLFALKFIFQRETPFNPNRKIAGSLILSTPGQHYLGYGLNKEESEKIKKLSQAVQTAKKRFLEAQAKNNPQAASLKATYLSEKKKYQSSLRHWAYLSFYFSNVLSVLRCLHGLFHREWLGLNWACWKPIDIKRTKMVEIGADRAKYSFAKVGSSPVLLSGDTLATVDPTTGLGCNTALITVWRFDEFLLGLEKKESVDQLLINYGNAAESKIAYIHQESKWMRKIYRPDAL